MLDLFRQQGVPPEAAQSVVDAEDRYLGSVTFPGKYQPIRAVGELFCGIARDDMDVQSLKVYRGGHGLRGAGRTLASTQKTSPPVALAHEPP
ncbi:MAG TPA: hypothetical protein VK849_10655 [Longimicrobiales bacterium]|nr:hypothetical protein [Longimicrobiales bacterium]